MLRWFICPDGEKVEVEKCLSPKGHRCKERCSSLPFLRKASYDRKWKGITASCAGTGVRQLYLKATIDYAVSPQSRAFAVLGSGAHDDLSRKRYTHNVLSEEAFAQGTPDELEQDEFKDGYYILIDYKTWKAFKVMRCIGMVGVYEPVLDDNDKPVKYKSGQRKGEVKTRKVYKLQPEKADMFSEIMQLNLYRMFYERSGFPISKMFLQVFVRDGGGQTKSTYGIGETIMISVPFLDNKYVRNHYINKTERMIVAYEWGYIEKCSDYESWNSRRCNGFCDVAGACKEMEGKK